MNDRLQRKIQRQLKESNLPAGKTLESIDDKKLPDKIRRQLPTLLEADFVRRGDNLLCFGLAGRGKTHLVAAIAREWICRHQLQVLFVPAFVLDFQNDTETIEKSFADSRSKCCYTKPQTRFRSASASFAAQQIGDSDHFLSDLVASNIEVGGRHLALESADHEFRAPCRSATVNLAEMSAKRVTRDTETGI